MIRFIGGKPGGGKSLFAVTKLVDELRSSNRWIVTNLALELQPWVDGGGKPRKGLLRSLQDKYGDDFEAQDRIVFLDDDQVRRFYAVRPKRDGDMRRAVDILGVEDDKRFRLSGRDGVFYVIDEAHEFFSAREWATTGKEVLSWASQQRRAGDDCWFLTQVIGNVEKQLRGVSQECYWVVNHRLARLGVFRQPDMLSYRLFGGTPPAPSEAALARGRVQCDREFIYGIYNTAKGVGVSGRQADIGVRAKGLHWSWLLIFVACFIVSVVVGLKGVKWGIAKAVKLDGSAVKAAAAVMPVLVTNVPVTNVGAGRVEPPLLGPVVIEERSKESVNKEVVPKVSGLMRGSHGTAVYLHPGGTYVAKSVREMPGGLLIDGRFHEWIGQTNR